MQLVPGDLGSVFNWVCCIKVSKSQTNAAVIFTKHA